MLMAMPKTVYGELGALLSAMIVVLSLIGLTMHNEFYAGIRRRDYWAYYTNLSNLLVFVYFSLIAPLLYAEETLRADIPHAEYALVMSIMLTHFVFHHMIYPRFRRQAEHAPHTREYAIVRTDSMLQHYVIPWLTFIYWLLCSPGKAALTPVDAVLFTAFPLLYLVFIFFRARVKGNIHQTDSAYPYPFLDIERLGAARVSRALLILFLICCGCGLGGVLLVRSAFALFGGGYALFLI